MNKIENDIFYVCSLIEFIGRYTKNHRGDVVRSMGKKMLAHQLEYADLNHCLTFEQVADEVIEDIGIREGDFDNVAECRYRVPTATEIGKVYQRLVLAVNRGEPYEDTIYDVFTSYLTEEISFLNSNVYYNSPQYLEESYYNGELLA